MPATHIGPTRGPSWTKPKNLDVFDPTTNQFTTLPPKLPLKSSSHAATLLPDGRVLFTGGGDRDNSVTHDVAAVFDPSTGTLAATASHMGAPRESQGAALLADGRALVVGGEVDGHALASAELFDPLVDIAGPTASKMLSPRIWHTATSIGAGRVLIAGGTSDRASTFPFLGVPSTLDRAEVFDAKAGSSTLLSGRMVHERRSSACARVGR